MATTQKIRNDIAKTKEKISEQQKRLRALETQLAEEENLEIVRMVKAVKMDNKELTAFLKAYASGMISLPEGMLQEGDTENEETEGYEDVTFSYDGSEQNEVLHDVNLELPEGSFTALVGPSGGGKSTIARLIARFWDVTGGSITIGGKNVKELSIRQLSELVSFVTQDNFLFNCSLKENIRLGNPNATDEEVYAAAKAACCDEFIVRLDKGYDTPAGDAGKRLSGGEKQRIAIARAILKNAPIVILDEATAFTDPQNEDKIQKSIMALSKGKTLLVIAHRLSTIQNADQIVVLKKGRIVDCGKQEELLKRCPLYADMWKAHIGAKNWSVSEKKEVAAHV